MSLHFNMLTNDVDSNHFQEKELTINRPNLGTEPKTQISEVLCSNFWAYQARCKYTLLL